MKKRIIAIALAILMLVAAGLVGCNKTQPAAEKDKTEGQTADKTEVKKEDQGKAKTLKKEDIKVGFLYVGEIGDLGYSFAHNQGRLALEKAGYKTVYVENVPEDETCAEKIRDLIDQGCNVIYATSFGHGPYVLEVAKEHPEVYFGHATGGTTADNVSVYMGRVYQARYLSGIAAGLETKSNKIGYVAAMQIPEVVRGINAFTLGVRSVNPKATVEVKWTNTWFDTVVEAAAASELLNNGCDIIAQHCDSTAPQTTAAEKGAKSIGYNSPTHSAAPNTYMTAPLFHWDVFYLDDVNSIVNGTWKSRNYWEGMNKGMVSLDECFNMADTTKKAIEDAKAKIIDGSLNPFAGEIKAQDGTVKVPKGKAMTDGEMLSFDWFVEGVIGSISK